jgi:hypothetical protein
VGKLRVPRNESDNFAIGIGFLWPFQCRALIVAGVIRLKMRRVPAFRGRKAVEEGVKLTCFPGTWAVKRPRSLEEFRDIELKAKMTQVFNVNKLMPINIHRRGRKALWKIQKNACGTGICLAKDRNVSFPKEHDSHSLGTLSGNIPTIRLPRIFRVKLRRWALLLCYSGLVASICGQEPTEPPPDPLPTPLPTLDPSPLATPFDDSTRNEETPKPPTGDASAPASPGESASADALTPVLGETLSREEQVRTKKWRVIPFARISVAADDNVFIQPTNKEKDIYFTLAPGVAIGWGSYEKEVKQLGQFEHYFELPDFELGTEEQNFAFVKYVPSLSLFTKLTDQDALDHDALVAGRWQFTKLTLGLRVRFQTLSGPDVDVGTRVKRDILTANLTSSYSLSEKTSLELNVSNSNYDYRDQPDYRETALEAWLAYQWLPKTTVSIGTQLGDLAQESSGNQTYEQVLLRLSYHATEKLNVLMDGGEELRQAESGGSSNLNSVFNFGAIYTPFDGTSVHASASRQTTAAVSAAGQTITTTGVSAQVKQRFFHRFYLGIEAGYSNADYRSGSTGTTTGRTDDNYYGRSSVSFDITKNLSAESAYQYRRYDSSEKTFSFVENIVTLQINLQF